MKQIQLTKGYVTLVDNDEFELLTHFKWCSWEDKAQDGRIRNVYAVRNIKINGKRTTQYMHRFILGITDSDVQVDHEDHNGLNNQRYNLRKATDAENNQNRRLPINNTSGLKGVSWNKHAQKWQAYVQTNGQRKHLGHFDSAEQAARVYDLAAAKYHGEFAFTNATLGDSKYRITTCTGIAKMGEVDSNAKI